MIKTIIVPRLRMLAAIAVAALATIALVLVVASGGNSALAASTLVNGNFETGDLSGWTVDTTASSGTASAVNSYYDCHPECWYWSSWAPQDGSYFAQLTPGKKSEDTKISQPFEASAGDRVSGWAFVEASDWGVWPYSPAVGEVVITPDSGQPVATPFQQSAVHCEAWWPCNGLWSYWEYTFPVDTETGKFKIEARIHNTGDHNDPSDWRSYVYSVMSLDNVKTATLGRDTTKPSTSATPSGEPNAEGWNKDNVPVNLKATDNEGGWGIKEITYRINEDQPTTKQGDGDGGASVWVPAITDEGETTISYYSTDNAGNVEDEQSLKVKIDKTAPKVESTSPADKATNVSTSSKISATFLESGSGIDPSTINTDTFKVGQWTRESGSWVYAQVSGTVSYDEASQKATFTPSKPLVKNATYNAEIKGYGSPPRVEDKADNLLREGWSYLWSFTPSGKLAF